VAPYLVGAPLGYAALEHLERPVSPPVAGRLTSSSSRRSCLGLALQLPFAAASR